MFVFYLLLFTPILIQHIAIKNVDYDKKNMYALTIFFVMLTLLLMFRDESVGNDTSNYIYNFQKISKMNWEELFRISPEFGFTYYNKIVSIFSENSQFFLAVTAIITVIMIYPTYRRLCLDASLTIVLFCIMSTFVMMFSGIRQMIAIGIGVRAYEYVRQKNMLAFVIAVIIAMTFHTSAFMLFFIYPIYYCKITNKVLYVVVPVMTVIFIFNEQIFGFLLKCLMLFTRFDIAPSYTGAYAMLMLFVLLAFFSYLVPNENLLDEETKGLRNLILLIIVIQMFAPLHTIAMRMNYYYIIFIPLLIPRIIKVRKNSLRQFVVIGRWVMVLFFMIYFFEVLVPSEVLHVFPYHFLWEVTI